MRSDDSLPVPRKLLEDIIVTATRGGLESIIRWANQAAAHYRALMDVARLQQDWLQSR